MVCDVLKFEKSSLFLISRNEYCHFHFQLVAKSNGPEQRKLAPCDAATISQHSSCSSVHFHGSSHPRSVLVDIRVNAILVWQRACLAPANNACKHPAAVSIQHWTGQRSSAIVRACVSAAFFESGTQKILSYRSVVRARKKKKWSIQTLTRTTKQD